ncbi:hypothetical protein [Anoxybacteroides rupiense]|nr:hypothetical protein [Anoxybacillus rupiensis]MBB3908085.1 hypothetical protein [Anoxybacillus rupiensis]
MKRLSMHSMRFTEQKEAVIELVDRVLEPYGGRLFTGFSIGKIKVD